MRTSDLATISELAAGHWGLLTTAQAQQAGVSRVQLGRMVDAGVLDRVAHGIYATPAAHGDELLSLRVAWLGLQPHRLAIERLADPVAAGVVSHTSAARLHHVGDLLADEHELTLPQRYQSTRAGIRVHRGILTAEEVTIVAGLPVTTAARTITDLLGGGHDLEHVGQVAADAIRQGLMTTQELTATAQRVVGRRGAPDGTTLTTHLLRIGGLPPHPLADRAARSSEVAIVVEGFRTLVDLLNEAGANPEVRAAAATSADLARLAAAVPNSEIRHRITAWLTEPDNQAALDNLLTDLIEDGVAR